MDNRRWEMVRSSAMGLWLPGCAMVVVAGVRYGCGCRCGLWLWLPVWFVVVVADVKGG